MARASLEAAKLAQRTRTITDGSYIWISCPACGRDLFGQVAGDFAGSFASLGAAVDRHAEAFGCDLFNRIEGGISH